jgi:hypothetical protein
MATQWGRKETIIWPPHVPVMSYSAVAAAILCTCFFIWQRLHFTLSPVQQSYITEYIRSQVGAKFNAHENYRLIYLGGVKARPRLALPVDITAGKTTLPDGRTLPVALAPLPTSQGYGWFFRAPARKFYDASMHRWLRDAVYGGKGVLELFELSLIEGAVCLAVMLWFSVPKDIKRFRMLKYGRVLRGPVMMTPTEFNDAQRATERRFVALERLQQLSFRFIGKQAPPPVRGIGFKTTEARTLMRIPASKEAQHIQIIGDTGTGKTQLIMQILRQIRDRGDAAIVYDPATEFVKRFYNEERGDVVLNPLDARCPFWSPANEMERNAEAVTIAASLYQPTSVSIKDEFFYRTPAQIFAHLLKTGPTPHELAAWMADEAELQRRVAGTEMAHYINRKAGPQATGVLSSLGLVAQSLRLLPRQEDATYKWNATDWAQERKGWIFVTSQLSEREVLRPLHSLWIDMLVMRLLGRPKPGQKRVWFVIDELGSLQRLPQLHTAITESRKSKNPMVLGFQGKGQLEDIYGRLAEVMLSQPATKIFMRTGEPKAAEWISESIGKVEIERLRETKFDGSRAGKNFTVDRQVEPLVMASEIGGLEDRHAYLKLGNNVARFVFEYLDSPGETPEFIPRKAADDELGFDRRTLTPRHPDSPKSDKAFAEEQPTTAPSAGTGRAHERGSGPLQLPGTETHELRPGSGRKQAMTVSEVTPTTMQPGSALDVEQSEQLGPPAREKHHDSVTLELGHS